MLPSAELKKLKTKLVKMFNVKHYETKGEIQHLEIINTNLKQKIADKEEAVTDPANESISGEIMALITKLKAELADNEYQVGLLSSQHENDLDEFLTFAFDFLGNKCKRFFGLSGSDMKWCEQLVFTGKIYVDAEKNVYTHDISPIFRGETNKKDAKASLKSNLLHIYRTYLNSLNGLSKSPKQG